MPVIAPSRFIFSEEDAHQDRREQRGGGQAEREGHHLSDEAGRVDTRGNLATAMPATPLRSGRISSSCDRTDARGPWSS